MPTIPATSAELSSPDGPSMKDWPFELRLMAEYQAYYLLNGTEFDDTTPEETTK